MATNRPGDRTQRERAESQATIAAIAAFIVVALVIGLWMWGERLPLAGRDVDSFGTRAAWISGGAAGLAFAAAFVSASRSGEGSWRRRLPLFKRIIDAIVLTVAFAAVSALSVEAVANLFQRGFVGLTIDALGGAALAGASGAFLAYLASVFGSRVTTANLAALATLVIFIGTLASMLTSPDDRWWEFHFSQLGNQEGTSAAAFNGALILTGLTITAFADYAARDAHRGMSLRGVSSDGTGRSDGAGGWWSLERRTGAVSWMLIVIGVCMMVAGLVHDAMNKTVHVGAASGMVVVFGLLAAFSLTMMPGIPRSFRVLTIGVMAGIVVAILLWIPIGYYALTGVEFVSAGLLFSWFIVYARTLEIYAERAE